MHEGGHEERDELEFRVFGSLEAVGPRGALRLGGRKERALLALLVVRAGEYVPFGTLLEEIWVNEPLETDCHNLPTRLSPFGGREHESPR